MTEKNVSLFELFSSEFKETAYARYQKLREEDPVHFITMPEGKRAWLITRYEDVVEILKDNRFTKDPERFLSPDELELTLYEEVRAHMLNADPPDHTRLRFLVQKAFTPRMIEELRNQIETISTQLLDQIESLGRMDIIQDYAYPLPIMVICEMLGIPSEDQTTFREWSNAIISSINHPELIKEVTPYVEKFIHYLQYIVEKRRNDPRDDLISLLIQAESDGSKLSAKELYSMIFLLIIAGHETTVNLIGNGVFALIQHPEELEKLKSDPAAIDTTVEEILRYSSPVEISTSRWATEDFEYKGKQIRKGDMAWVSIASANRDPEVFSEPDRFDIDRKRNKHIAFGVGIHYCLGAPLARMEGQIALLNLFQRFSHLQLVPSDKPDYLPGILMRGFAHLPITFQTVSNLTK